jgi:hypothetical protein
MDARHSKQMLLSSLYTAVTIFTKKSKLWPRPSASDGQNMPSATRVNTTSTFALLALSLGAGFKADELRSNVL